MYLAFMRYIEFFISFAYFILIGLSSYLVIKNNVSLSTLMQIFTILIFIVFITMSISLTGKLSFLRVPPKFKNYLLLAAILPMVSLINFLILSTDLLFSPFLILSHLFAIGLAFFLSLQTSFAYIFTTVAFIIFNLIAKNSLKIFITQDSFLAIIYSISYVGLFPFVYILAREYKVKGELNQILESQIATSKTQEEELLKDISDAVVVLNTYFDIIYINNSAHKLLKYGEEIIGKNFFALFSFENKEGQTLQPFSLPLAQTLNSKIPSFIQDIRISTKDKSFIHIKMRIIPAISADKSLGLILVIGDKNSQKEKTSLPTSSLNALARDHFHKILTSQKQSLTTLQESLEKQNYETISSQNKQLTRAINDFILVQQIESGEIDAIQNLVDIAKILEKLITSSLPPKGITIKVIDNNSQPNILLPKQDAKLSQNKKTFPKSYVLGNDDWITESIKKILQIAYFVTTPKSNLEIGLKNEDGLVKIVIICQKSQIPTPYASHLLQKYYGQLRDFPNLSSASGLEGYISKYLLDRMGANVEVSAAPGKPSLTFTITFGAKDNPA